MTAAEPWGDVPHVPDDFQPPTMSINHANRNRNNAAAVPTPAEIRKARLAADLTPQQAGALVHERANRWLRFENGEAHMHPASWELFNLKLAQRHGGELAASRREPQPGDAWEDREDGALYYVQEVRDGHVYGTFACTKGGGSFDFNADYWHAQFVFHHSTAKPV